MKKFLLITVAVLLAGFISGNHSQPAFAAEKGKYGGILKINHAKTAAIIGNPINIVGWNNEFASIPLEGLIQYDPDEPGKLVPELATGWELAPDRSHYIMKLRRGVKFHDGTDFNAQAVKWNLDRWRETKSPIFEDLTSIDVIDDYTVRFNLSSWSNLILHNFVAFGGPYIISPTAFEKNGEKWANYNPVGTGPFKMVEYNRKVILKFEKFKDYYEEGIPFLDGLHIYQIIDPMTAMASLKRGDIDAWMSTDPISASELAKEGKWEVQGAPGPAFFLNYNSVDPESPFFKKEVREALEYAIDRDKIAELSGRGFREGVWTLFYGLDHEKAGTTPRRHNPEKAKQMLNEAGYPNGFEVQLFYHASTERDAATAFQSYLNNVGITTRLEPVEGAAWHGKAFTPMKSGELLYGWIRPSPSALKAANVTFVKDSWPLMQRLKRPAGLDEILVKAFNEVDRDKALQHLYQAEKLVYDFAMFSPVLFRQAIEVNAPYVKGAHWGYGFIPRFNLERCWLDK